MNMKKSMPILFVCHVAVLLLASCATPERRSREYPELFQSYGSDVQQRVLSGRVEVGDTPHMAYVALGAPTRIYERSTGDGFSTVWSYVRYDARRRYESVRADWRYTDAEGRSRVINDTLDLTLEDSVAVEMLRLVFENSRVAEILRLDRDARAEDQFGGAK